MGAVSYVPSGANNACQKNNISSYSSLLEKNNF